MSETAIEFMRSHPHSKMWDMAGGKAENITGRAVFEAFRMGDQAAKHTVKRYVSHLASGIVNILNIFEPDIICIGGSLSNSWDCFGEDLILTVDAEKYTRHDEGSNQSRIVKATLGEDAGIIGAAMLR
jgi:glucokinase